MPMVCERRGVHPTVIGNGHFTHKEGHPPPTPSGLSPFCRRLLVLSWTPTRAPTGSRPLSMRSTTHARQQECAYKHSVRYISRSRRRTSRLAAPMSADHHRHAHLEEKKQRRWTLQHTTEIPAACAHCSCCNINFRRPESFCAKAAELVSTNMHRQTAHAHRLCVRTLTLLTTCSLCLSTELLHGMQLGHGFRELRWRLKRSIFVSVILAGSLLSRSKTGRSDL